jgi:hypothetical protein
MHLRYVLVIMSGIGAAGSLLMALDFYRHLKEAERLVFVNNISPSPDSILHIGMGHVGGLIAIGFICMALLLLLLQSLKDPAMAAAIENQPAPPATTVITPQPNEETAPFSTPPHEVHAPVANDSDAGTGSRKDAETPKTEDAHG